MASSSTARPSISSLISSTISFTLTLVSIALILCGGFVLLIIPSESLIAPFSPPYAGVAILAIVLGFLLNHRTETTLMTKTALFLFAVLCTLYGLNGLSYAMAML